MKYDNFRDAYLFLENHPAFKGRFLTGALDIAVVKVDPSTERIEDEKERNTAVRVWLESGPYEDGHFVHDIALDCGAPTFEEAILHMKELVLAHYGDYEVLPPTEEELAEMDRFIDDMLEVKER